MINGRIELYEDNIRFPQQNEKSNVMAQLVYVTPNVGSIIEHAGRTCYRSFNNIKEDSYKTFISGIVKSGHESVIEHSNMVYIILKTNNKDAKTDSNNINRFLINMMMYNGLLKVTENQAFYTISGNIRMFKDLIREYVKVKKYNNKNNPIMEDIMKSFYTLPEYFFIDMINNGILDKARFKLNPRFIESSNSTQEKALNKYVTVVNHDTFSFKVRGFNVKDGDSSDTHRISIPEKVLRKHNRMTVIIDAPRYITHQIVRHRLASYSQASQRYCLEDGLNVYIPEAIAADPTAKATASMLFNSALSTYKALIDENINKEDARAVLTNGQMSTVVMTATIEEFYHFVSVRADKAAQNFIRDMIAVPIKEYLENYYAGDEREKHKVKMPTSEKAQKAKRYQRKFGRGNTDQKASNSTKTGNGRGKDTKGKPNRNNNNAKNTKPKAKFKRTSKHVGNSGNKSK